MSDYEASEMSPSIGSVSFSSMVSPAAVPQDEVERVWSGHVSKVMSDHTQSSHTTATFLLFARLIQVNNVSDLV